MWRQTSKKINRWVGYRSGRSMRNPETWKFANEHCGQLWWRIGWVMLPVSALIHVPFLHSSVDTIGTVGGILCTVQSLFLIFSAIPTEVALKRRFTEDGERK